MSTKAILQVSCKGEDLDNYEIFAKHVAAVVGLTPLESRVFAETLRQRYILSQEMPMEWVVKLLLSPKVTEGVRAKFHMTMEHYQVIRSKLRKAGVLLGNDINPDYLLNSPISREPFNLLLITRFVNE